MEKINFVNDTTPALNATNLNMLQQNVEESMKNEYSESLADTYSCDYINNLAENGLIEKGTWTPVLKCRDNETAPTYTTRNVYGNYRKIGDLVYIEFYVRGNITQLNGTNNYIEIGGLPFTNHTAGFGQQALSIGVIYDLTSSDTSVNKTMCILGNAIALQRYDGSGATQYKVTTASYFQLGGSGWYIATS